MHKKARPHHIGDLELFGERSEVSGEQDVVVLCQELLFELFRVRRRQARDEGRYLSERLGVWRNETVRDGVEVARDDGDSIVEHGDGVALCRQAGNDDFGR